MDKIKIMTDAELVVAVFRSVGVDHKHARELSAGDLVARYSGRIHDGCRRCIVVDVQSHAIDKLVYATVEDIEAFDPGSEALLLGDATPIAIQ